MLCFQHTSKIFILDDLQFISSKKNMIAVEFYCLPTNFVFFPF